MKRPSVFKYWVACGIGLALSTSMGALPARGGDLQFAVGRPFDITHIKLDIYLELENEFVRGRAKITGKALRPLDVVRFDAVGFEEVRVMIQTADESAHACPFENDGEQIIIRPEKPLAVGAEVDFFIDYTLNKPTSGLHFYAPSAEDPEAPYLVWSQGQSIENRYWVPCFDHPNERQSTELSCTVAKPYEAISNGKLMDVKENKDGSRTFHWVQDQPHVSYLITLVVGEFASEKTTWRDVPVSYYAAPKYKAKLAGSFENTPKMLEFFSEKIGVDYPWKKYAQLCCYGFGGGMENTSATTLGERAMVDERGKLDDDPDGLIAHELAHQWYGDLLTCRDWAHIWLNEGFASYFEALWDEENCGAEEFANNMRQKAGGAIRGGADHPVVWRGWSNPDEQFDNRAYPKGAWVLHMVRRRLGDDLFWKVMKTYTERYAYQCVETTDFRKTIEDVTGYSFERFFYDWTERAGSPAVKVTYKWVDEDRLARIKIEQTQKEEPFFFPLKLEFRFSEREPRVMTQDVTERSSTFYYSLPERPTAFRIDPDQAVLMTLTRQQSKAMWVALLADENPAARIDAVDHFGEEGSEGSIERLARRMSEETFWAVQARIAEKLGHDGGETARDALLSSVKGVKDARARRVVVEQLGEFPEDDAVSSALEKIVKNGDASYRVESAAIEAYATVHEGDAEAMAVVASTLDRDSDRDVIRSAALAAIGAHGDDDSFEVLKSWATQERASVCRAAAVRAMGSMVSREMTDEAQTKEVVDLISSIIEMKRRDIQFAALNAAGDCGAAAMPVVQKIEKLAIEGNRRVRRLAKETAEKIRKKQPEKDELSELREVIKRLEKALRDQGETMKKLEARGSVK